MKIITFSKSTECKKQDEVKPDSIIYSGKINDLNIKNTVMFLDEQTGGFYGIRNKEININIVSLIKSITDDTHIMLIKDNAP